MQGPGSQAEEARINLMNNRKLVEILKKHNNKIQGLNLETFFKVQSTLQRKFGRTRRTCEVT